MALITLKDFSFSYNTKNKKVLKNINMDINQGDKILFLGLSGSSKSTLLSMLKPSARPYGVCTNDIEYNISDTDISIVVENVSATFLSKKVISNIVFTAENMGLPKDEIERRLGEVCTTLSLTKILDKDIDALSGGEKQLVAIACAIITYPKVLLLDEPLAEMSPSSRKMIMEILNLLHDEMNMTIILCEHQVNDCISFCDKIAYLEDGFEVYFDNKDIVLKNLYENNKTSLFVPDIQKLSLKLKNEVYYTVSDFKKNISFKQMNMPIYVDKTFTEPIIICKNITSFYDKKDSIILNELNLTIYKNEKIAILGDNGSGKTTLLKILAKIKKPYDGTLKFKNQKIGYLPQNVSSYFTKETVFDELKKYSDNPKDEKIVKLFKLEKLFDLSPLDISSGEALMVCLSAIILSKADVLILDEPTRNLDVFTKEIFGNFIKTCDKTVIITSHDLEFCASYVDNCAFLFNKSVSYKKNSKQFMLENTLYTTSIKKCTKMFITYDETKKVTEDDLIC